MPRTRKADSIVKNEEGFVTATIFSIEDSDSNYSGDQFRWVFLAPTTKGKQTTINLWSGVSFNPKKDFEDPDTKEIGYNKLTTMGLRLNVITEEQLHVSEEISIELAEELVEKTVQFKMKPSRKRAGLEEIIVSSIRLVD